MLVSLISSGGHLNHRVLARRFDIRFAREADPEKGQTTEDDGLQKLLTVPHTVFTPQILRGIGTGVAAGCCWALW